MDDSTKAASTEEMLATMRQIKVSLSPVVKQFRVSTPYFEDLKRNATLVRELMADAWLGVPVVVDDSVATWEADMTDGSVKRPPARA